MSASSASPVGCVGRVSEQGAIRPGRVGEVLVSIRGGLESFLAEDADGGSIGPDEEIVVVDYTPPRTVLVTRLNGELRADAAELEVTGVTSRRSRSA